ncbi:MAG TPA: hypothetical protein VFB25_02005 [Gaiellaceae bacterium]|nr:hypothetical protein [Gaiellaceae bacterium]
MASWPFSPEECPRCRYLEPIDPPAVDDAGYEIVGFCLHPRIGMDLFLFRQREQKMDSCPCFHERRV